jgi:hypothetical protein
LTELARPFAVSEKKVKQQPIIVFCCVFCFIDSSTFAAEALHLWLVILIYPARTNRPLCHPDKTELLYLMNISCFIVYESLAPEAV